MNTYFFKKLAEKVNKAEIKSILDFDFDDPDFDEVTFESAWFQIHETANESYYIRIDDGKVTLTADDDTICQITGETSEKWLKNAETLFWARYADDIEEAKQEKDYWSWVDYQDALGELQRHGL